VKNLAVYPRNLQDKLTDALEPYWARFYPLISTQLDLRALRPILVLGNQKTGSSAVAHLLAAHGDLSLAADVHPAQGRERHVASLDAPAMAGFIQRARYYFRRDVVKENALTPGAGALLAALPNARAVFVARHPAHNVRSILDRLDLPGHPCPLGEIQVESGWQEVVDGSALGLNASDHITALARRWQALTDTYLLHRERLHLVRYEDFQTDKSGVIAELAERCDAPRRADIGPLLDRPFQPRGKHRTTPLEDFFSEEALRIIDRCCAGGRRALDYDPILTRSSS
jgi:hypothetical protein